MNAAGEPVVRLALRGPSGLTREVDAVVDTGFTGFLTLPPAIVTALDLRRADVQVVVLADGSRATLTAHAVEVSWDGRLRDAFAYAAGSTPLIGIALMDGYRLCIDVERGGQVSFEPRA